MLVGKLGHSAQAYRPFYFLVSYLYLSIAFVYRKNQAFFVNTSKRFRALIKKTKQYMIHFVAADERDQFCSQPKCEESSQLPHESLRFERNWNI